MSNKPIPQGYATLYACMIPRLIPIAREHGYCFALHGSLANDLDAVCVPWIEDASDEKILIGALRDCIGGFVVCGEENDRMDEIGEPHINPHNRHTYTISFGGSMYMDITVMPKIQKSFIRELVDLCNEKNINFADITIDHIKNYKK